MEIENWIVSEFAEARGFGRLRSRAGVEVTFQLEAWVPGDPAVARSLQDSEQRRHFLLPQLGEQVEVSWKTNRRGEIVPARVARKFVIESLPRRRFADWLVRVGDDVPEVANWQTSEWGRIAAELDEDISDTVFSNEEDAPERHLGFLAWLSRSCPKPLIETRLSWIHRDPGKSLFAVEAQGYLDVVYLKLSRDCFEGLVEKQLVSPVKG